LFSACAHPSCLRYISMVKMLYIIGIFIKLIFSVCKKTSQRRVEPFVFSAKDFAEGDSDDHPDRAWCRPGLPPTCHGHW
jgi:hypothetical protein